MANRPTEHEMMQLLKLHGELDAQRSLYMLPHHKRFSITQSERMTEFSFPGLIEEIDDFVRNVNGSGFLLEHASKQTGEFNGYVDRFSGAAGETVGAQLHLLIAWRRFVVSGGTTITMDPDLYELLNLTDIGANMPVSYFSPPYPCNYFELPVTTKLTSHHPASGEHLIEGFYLNRIDNSLEVSELYNAIGADPASSRHYEVVVVSRPLDTNLVPKENGLMDDQFYYADFIVPDEDNIELAGLVDRHIQYFKTVDTDVRVATYDEIGWSYANWRALLELAAKLLIFMASPEVRRETHMDATEIQKAMDRVKNPAKRRKHEKKLRSAYDRIVISAPKEGKGIGEGEGSRSVSTHWRRGHFRNQPTGPRDNPVYHPRWIAPMLIGKEGLPTTKDYHLKK